MQRVRVQRIGITLVLTLGLGLAACGGDDSDGSTSTEVEAAATTATVDQEPSPAEQAEASNNAVIEEAQEANDAQAEGGEKEVIKSLTDELGMQKDGEFDLDGSIPAGQVGGDCYVKTGADAVNFSYMQRHVLYSPNGTDLIWVQTSTGTPLADCLVAVRRALGS